MADEEVRLTKGVPFREGRTWEPLGETHRPRSRPPRALESGPGCRPRCCWWAHARARSPSRRTPAARALGRRRGPRFSATSSITWCSIRATGARCCVRRAPGTSGPPSFARSTTGRAGRRPQRPPACEKAPEGEKGHVVEQVFWLSPGHADEEGTWYAGTAPEFLFRSEDGGMTLGADQGLERASTLVRVQRRAGRLDARRLAAALDQRGSARSEPPLPGGLVGRGLREHRRRSGLASRSTAGVEANFMPDPYPEIGQDTHCLQHAPAGARRPLPTEPLRDLPLATSRATEWERIGDNMPKDIGDIGFGIALHPRDPATAWVFPDGRQRRLAAHQPRRPPGRLPHARLGQDLGAPGRGACRSATPGSR